MEIACFVFEGVRGSIWDPDDRRRNRRAAQNLHTNYSPLASPSGDLLVVPPEHRKNIPNFLGLSRQVRAL